MYLNSSHVFPMAALLADIVVVVHLLWILFLVFGFVFALRQSKIAYVHMGGLIFALVLNVMGWYCPLTHLENALIALHDVRSTYSTSFIARYAEKLLYPDIPESYLRGGEILLTIVYLLVYAYWAGRAGFYKRLKNLGRRIPGLPPPRE
jgi:hypothetical protein